MTLMKDLLTLFAVCVAGFMVGVFAIVFLFPPCDSCLTDEMTEQNLLSLMTFAVPAVAFAYIKTRGKKTTDLTERMEMVIEEQPLPNICQNLAMDHRPTVFMVVSAIIAMISIQPLSDLLAHFNEQWTLPESLKDLEKLFRELSDTANAGTKSFLDFSNHQSLLSIFFTLALIPAVCEEMLFRGALQPLFTSRWGIHLGILATAVIFSAFHFDFFGFLPRFVMGVMLGYLFVFTGNLWVNIVAHLTNNGFIVLYVFLRQYYFGKNVNESMELSNDMNENVAIALVFGAFTIVIMSVLWARYYHPKHTKE